MTADDQLRMLSLLLYAALFGGFVFIVGSALRVRGKVFLDHTFSTQPAVTESVHFLLNLGFYLISIGLLLWNLGVSPSYSSYNPSAFTALDLVQTVALGLGVSISVVAAFHTLNLLVPSILNRKNHGEHS